jgi:lysozyme
MKYLKILIIIGFLELCSGCLFEPKVTTEINLVNNLTFNYGDELYLYSLVSIIDGNITDQNYLINTDTLGEEQIKFNYKDSNKHKQTYELTINIVDTTPPILSVPKNIYVNQGSDINLLSKVFCGDNATRNLVCEVTGDYDMNTIGIYPLLFTATDESGNTSSANSNLHVISPTNNNSTSIDDGKPLNYFIKNYHDQNTEFGIDLSSHQGTIDFQKVKDAGITFVMLRIGYGPDSNGEMTLDKYFNEYYEGAKSVGLKVGVYLYSYATTVDEALIQADWTINTLSDKEIDLPVAYDWESWNTFYSCGINFYDLNKIAKTYLLTIKDKGYQVLNYGSKYYLSTIWNLPEYNTWLAQYNDTVTYNNTFKMWQISETGIIDGIDTLVDIDILYN